MLWYYIYNPEIQVIQYCYVNSEQWDNLDFSFIWPVANKLQYLEGHGYNTTITIIQLPFGFSI